MMMGRTLAAAVALGLFCSAPRAKGDAPMIFCDGAVCGGAGPTRYAYPVDSASFPMIDFRVGTNDLDIRHYENVLVPAGWSFAVEQAPMPHLHGVKTPHGKDSPGPCRCLTQGSAHWWTDDAKCAVEWFTFGFDHPWAPEDVGWILTTQRDGQPPKQYVFRENWDALVGVGYGPVHGPSGPPRPGDLDADGDVDFADYLAVKAAFGIETGAAWKDGDSDADGDVDFLDYLTVKANFGAPAAGAGSSAQSPAAAPEPATLSLLALAALFPLRRRIR